MLFSASIQGKKCSNAENVKCVLASNQLISLMVYNFICHLIPSHLPQFELFSSSFHFFLTRTRRKKCNKKHALYEVDTKWKHTYFELKIQKHRNWQETCTNCSCIWLIGKTDQAVRTVKWNYTNSHTLVWVITLYNYKSVL